jgi:pyrimidine-nucleoside phosphorylase
MMRDIIANKRDGRELTSEEIRRAVNEYTAGRASEAEMAALLMAIVLRGMTPRETTDLTLAMADSGERLDLSSIPGTKVDKHSTGGVGDKTTLVVAPLVAACGVPVPKMSGRALGHTGGTIDKLECIPGLITDLAPDRFCRQVAEIGVAVAAQSDRMAPADQRIYALRDATATVESMPLIASSIMSKKLAVGADGIVLDVKAGSGAFMRDVQQAQELAKAMVQIGAGASMKAVALVTRMDEPLGCAVGDAVEMMEAIATLAGDGPPDFVELCEIVAGHMLALGGACSDPEEGRQLARQRLVDGRGLEKLREMVRWQGGDGEVIGNPQALIRGAELTPVAAPRDGVVVSIDARRVGVAIREMKSAAGDHKRVCGALLHKKVSHTVTHGEPIATVLAPAGMGDAVRQGAEQLAASFAVGEKAARPGPLIGVIET